MYDLLLAEGWEMGYFGVFFYFCCLLSVQVILLFF